MNFRAIFFIFKKAWCIARLIFFTRRVEFTSKNSIYPSPKKLAFIMIFIILRDVKFNVASFSCPVAYFTPRLFRSIGSTKIEKKFHNEKYRVKIVDLYFRKIKVYGIQVGIGVRAGDQNTYVKFISRWPYHYVYKAFLVLLFELNSLSRFQCRPAILSSDRVYYVGLWEGGVLWVYVNSLKHCKPLGLFAFVKAMFWVV